MSQLVRQLSSSRCVSKWMYCLSTKRWLSKKVFDDSDPKTVEIKKELTDLKDKQRYNEYSQQEMGCIYAKKPHKYLCKEGKAYLWCSCGRSHRQPFCDGTHKNLHLKIPLRPVRWECTETKEYWFCNCKQTTHRPFCDGTHNNETVQSAQSTVRDANSPPFVNTTINTKS
ncbi:uncharacterized protein LOC128963794 [Oppia nitens]|uniref:uncharacterized protein LOC128963794 n=1 Tax=Oppia nitens TaxID=1686743 RepID=UPI0023DC2CA2|nr:uncharacterized protein LOC128963794 [Oppia nitens]